MKTGILTSIVLTLLVPFARAQQCPAATVDTFTGGANVGGWSWGLGPIFPTSGGFPGEYLRVAGLDTFAPQLSTTVQSVFTGNYRANGVTSLAVDLQSFHIDFPTSCQRPLSLVLACDNGTPVNPNDDFYVYFVGDQIPCIDGLWHSYTIDVPSQSATMPAGWGLDPNSTLTPDVAWNIAVQRVTRVTWFFGDPTFFFIFQMWTVGADNLRISTDGGPTTYCLSKLNSVGCQPAVQSSGTPSASQPAAFTVSAVQEINNKSGTFFYGFGAQNVPFQGGTLCVTAPIKRTPTQNSGGNPPPNDCSGAFAIDFNARIQSGVDPALVAGATVFGQYWARDQQSPSTTSLSNAIRFSICP